ncbi:unnamed protein product [Rotaria sordida]|uniref:Uncharacterized protein n=1 Tax=Rotaria sordida TaxID=392033 RepID=A0A814EB22_9BILA|nr:unnamed protein product [Rotaria sordida]
MCIMIKTKVFLVCLFIVAIIERSNGAFQCYKCNDCGSTWNPNKAVMVFTEGGNNYCTKRVVGTSVTKDFSATCTTGSGLHCCQNELCNSSNPQYHINFGLLLLLSMLGLIMQKFN